MFQQKPDKHINAKHGCHKCCNGGIQLTHEEFETKGQEKFMEININTYQNM